MSKTKVVLLRIVGSVVGLLVSGVLGCVGAALIVAGMANGDEDAGLAYTILLWPPGFLLGATIGAALGATTMQRVLGQRCSFWKALLGTVAGLLVGGLPTALCVRASYDHGIWHDGLAAFLVAVAVACASAAAGAVFGSGWKAKPAKATGSPS